MPIWDDVLSDLDRAVLEAAGYGQRQELGSNPVLLIVDTNYAFVGREPLPVVEAARLKRTSCGERGWEAIPAIQELLSTARSAGVPIIYTTGQAVTAVSALGRWAGKNRRATEDLAEDSDREIVAEIAPQDGDLVIEKAKPSAFFGTALLSTLIETGVDSLVVAGGTTSGCVRATVVDAFSFNLKVAVVAEGTFDRSEISHKVNLLDMNAKYADVLSLEEGITYLESIGRARSDE